MGGSSTPTPVTSTQTKDPWINAQPFLNIAMNNALNNVNNNVGYQPFTGATMAGVDPSVATGIGAQNSIASGSLYGTPGVLAAQNLATNMIQNQGMNAGLNTAASQFGSIYSDASTANNPYLEGVINQQMNKANSAMSGAGRYGSGQHSAAVAQAIAPVLAQDYAQRQQTRMGATGSLADLYGQGLQRAGQYSQLVPGLDAAQYAPAERMAATGQYYQDRAQQQIADDIKLYNAQQAYPWEQLNRFNAVIQGPGALGGTMVSTSPGATQPSATQRLFGGALAGAGLGTSIMPGIGTGIGALGGGLLGLL